MDRLRIRRTVIAADFVYVSIRNSAGLSTYVARFDTVSHYVWRQKTRCGVAALTGRQTDRQRRHLLLLVCVRNAGQNDSAGLGIRGPQIGTHLPYLLVCEAEVRRTGRRLRIAGQVCGSGKMVCEIDVCRTESYLSCVPVWGPEWVACFKCKYKSTNNIKFLFGYPRVPFQKPINRFRLNYVLRVTLQWSVKTPEETT